MDKRSFIFILILSLSLFFFNQWIAPPAVTVKIDLHEFSEDPAEKLFVLENESQQIVFSNIGGAIRELNLPFADAENKVSIVQPIEFDRNIEKHSPLNAQFPLSPASFFDAKTKSVDSYAPKIGGYTPQLRRSIRSSETGFSHIIEPRYYLGQLLNEEGNLDSTLFQMTHISQNKIEFSGQVQGQQVIKSYELVEPYGFKLTVTVKNNPHKPLFLTTGIGEVELVSGGYAPSMQVLNQKGEKLLVEKIDLPTKEIGVYTSMNPIWLSNSNGFFGQVLNPQGMANQSGFRVGKIEGAQCPTRLSLIDQKYDLYPIDSYPAYEIRKQLPPQAGSYTFNFYAGPYEEAVLTKASQLVVPDPSFQLVQSIQGWFSFISEPFSRLMFFIMKLCYSFTHSWGLAIIAVTIVLRILMYPLNRWSNKSMAKISALQPELQAIDDRCKKDPKKAQVEKMRLYQERGVNPLGGCLPMLLQLPFLLGMFDLFKTNFELRGASFLIPAWIPNLAAPDILFSWGLPLPYFGNALHILPLITGLAMVLQSRLMTRSVAVKPKSDQPQMPSPYIMALISTVAFYHFASGLHIYYAFSTFLGVGQQYLMMRKHSKPKIEILKK